MRFPSKRDLGALIAAGTLSGCSMIYDLSPDQCGTNADCSSFGENYLCEAGMCKIDPNSGGLCTSHDQCLNEDPNTPRACIELEPGKASTRDCVRLTTPNCPRMLPTGDGANGELWKQQLRQPGAIIIGAFGVLPNEGYSIFSRNYDLALMQLAQNAQGVRGTDGTRPIVAVMCNNDFMGDSVPVLENVRHLVDDVRVPAIIANMLPDDLQAAFNQTRQSEVNPDVLFLSPNSSTESLAELRDNNLIWNLLTNGEQVAIAYGPLLTRTIDYLRAHRGVPAGENIKVAVVYANDRPVFIDIKRVLPDILYFNDMDYRANESEGFLEEIQVPSWYQTQDDPLTGQIDRILEFAPHVVIELGANELFRWIIPGVEESWAAEVPDQPRPFYLMSPQHYGTAQDLPQVIGVHSTPDQINLRMAGVNFAGTPEEYLHITETWLADYANQFPDDPSTPDVDESDTTGAENIWDAPWYVIGAIAATTGSTDEFTGLDLAQGMLLLQDENGTRYNVGGEDIRDVVADLGDRDGIYYIGTMGEPTFDSFGVRTGSGSVWCVTNVVPAPGAQQLADVLRVDPGADAMSHADDTLVGDGFAPCNPDF